MKPQDELVFGGERLGLLNRQDASAFVFLALVTAQGGEPESIPGSNEGDEAPGRSKWPEPLCQETHDGGTDIPSHRAEEANQCQAGKEDGQINRDENQFSPAGQVGAHQETFHGFEDGGPRGAVQAVVCDVDGLARLEVEGLLSNAGGKAFDTEAALCARWMQSMEIA